MEPWRMWIETEPVEEAEWDRLIEDLLDALSRERRIYGVVGWGTAGPVLGSIFDVEARTVRKALGIGLDAFERALRTIDVEDLPIRRVEIAPESFQDDELLGAVDGARLLGVSRQRFYQLQDKPGFPQPAAELARGALWRRADIEAFAASRSRRVAG